jgi:GTP-binding protein EngB required for normal cell division
LSLDLYKKGSDPLGLVCEIASRYSIAALEQSIRICQSALKRDDLSIAVLGRFKAGKSSFLNHFIGRDLLPVGVIPVTSVVTEMAWAPKEDAEIRFSDGRIEHVGVKDLGAYVTEANNPENVKKVSGAFLHVPGLERYKGLRFVDTPGLESAFVHNTGTSLAWAPNTDLAIVAVGVDPPLTQQDLILIRKLFEYTPKVCVLLTKVDVLTETEVAEVLHFVREQLNRNFDQSIEVFPYSTRPGFESLKFNLEEQFISPMLLTLRTQKEAVASHKIQVLLRECADYLQLALRAAETQDNEKQRARRRALAGRDTLAAAKWELELVARHTTRVARYHVEKILAPHEKEIAANISAALEREYPTWKLPFARLLEHFGAWLGDALRLRLSSLSTTHEEPFLQPVRDVQRQYLQILQGFRDRLSGRALELFGVPLRTTETEIISQSPGTPDVKIGRVFDHNWELLSPIIPMALIGGAVKARFHKMVGYETFKSLSRLTTQWTDIVAQTILGMQREAELRLEQLIQTVENLTTPSTVQVTEIASELDRVRAAQESMEVRSMHD